MKRESRPSFAWRPRHTIADLTRPQPMKKASAQAITKFTFEITETCPSHLLLVIVGAFYDLLPDNLLDCGEWLLTFTDN